MSADPWGPGPGTTRPPPITLEATERLIMLEGDVESQRLVITWPIFAPTWEEALHGVTDVQMAELVEDDDDDQLRHDWEGYSRVDRDRIRRLAPALFRTGLIHADGTADPLAMQYVRTRMAEQLLIRRKATR
jgi:hypothetical protein